MITKGEFVSRVVNDINAIAKDVWVSKRWVLGIGEQKSKTYISQRWDSGSIFGEEDLFTNIKCLKMKRIQTIDCCFEEFRVCGVLMRSEESIPGLIYANARPSILTVTSVDDGISFDYVSLRRYKNESSRKYSKIGGYYYYVQDGYIYIPDVRIDSINVSAITLERDKALSLSGCAEESDDCYDCSSAWDEQFTCPQKLYEYVVDETIKECALRLGIPKDENPNMDSNIKSSTTQ